MKQKLKNFNFKHSLGQNFIIDEFLLEDIVNESDISKDDLVLEIGPGNGALTKCLAVKAKFVVAIEVDKTLIPLLKSNLKEYDNISLINDDFLKINFDIVLSEFCKYIDSDSISHIKVVSNLPYYITSPIINCLLFNPYIDEMTLMVQKEVAERIVATPNTRDYGILTLACNYFAKTSIIMLVAKECFYPIPKVDSAVVHFKKFQHFTDLSNQNNYHLENDEHYNELFKLIKASFSQRRKKLLNSLVNTLKFDKNTILNAFTKLNLNECVRAENLSLQNYTDLLSILKN